MLIVYVIGAPLLAFFVLFKNRKNLDKPEIIKYILLLYQGLRHERYYWELVNTFRKCTLLGLQVFIPDNYKIVKALIGVLILFLWALMQARLKPFKIYLISQLGNSILFYNNRTQRNVGKSNNFIWRLDIHSTRFTTTWTYNWILCSRHSYEREIPNLMDILNAYSLQV